MTFLYNLEAGLESMNLESCIVICKNIRGNFMKVENPPFMQKKWLKIPHLCKKWWFSFAAICHPGFAAGKFAVRVFAVAVGKRQIVHV